MQSAFLVGKIRCREQFVDRTGEQLQSGASELSDEEANDKALKMMGV